jgi:hypothetical protein
VRATWCIALAAALIATDASALPRDKAQRAEFQRHNPCPATGKTKGPCPGYEVDHIRALMNGGADKPSNMQWSHKEDHKAKTRQDIAECKASTTCRHKKLRHQPQ